MALSHSFSEPQLSSHSWSSSPGSPQLTLLPIGLKGASAGSRSLALSGSTGSSPATTSRYDRSSPATASLYDRMLQEGKIRDDVAPRVRPAGRSTTLREDSVAQDLQSEIYFPAPSTPTRERRFRRLSHGPGESHVHHGLKDQQLPPEEWRYGVRTITGVSVGDCLKAGQKSGVEEYEQSRNERIYDSVKREPLGKSFNRGHSLKMRPEGFGSPSGTPVDGKKVIYPTDVPQQDEDTRIQYRQTHNNYLPGERAERNYHWPSATQAQGFRFGGAPTNAAEGAGVRLAMNMDVEDDGSVKRTRVVQKGVEDYRNVAHPKLFKKSHAKQGAEGSPLGHAHRYGIRSPAGDSAGSCISGSYSLEEQLPDQDLGRCTKAGRRNMTSERRAFGVPSVRTDIPAPHPSMRSIANETSYGDEVGAAAVLAPQRFNDGEFLVRRPRAELEELMREVPLENADFHTLWGEGVKLFADGLPLVSVDAMFSVHSRRTEADVATRHRGLHRVAEGQRVQRRWP